MTKYSNEYSPAAPLAHITISNIESAASIRNVPMLLDTGSDITLIPISVCTKLGIDVAESKPLELVGFDGSKSVGFYVQLAIQIDGMQFRGNFVAFDQVEGILGRNVLNAFSILLDGPNLEWDIVKG